MGTFSFKKFKVQNERSAMKVNTDGVLLGALMTLYPTDRRLLDVGTGTGTIALMAAQRCLSLPSGEDNSIPAIRTVSDNLQIDAIDIDEPSALEAGMNFQASDWSDHLSAYNMSLDEFAASHNDRYDLIFSNPPYFEESLPAPEGRRSNARHTYSGLSYRDLLEFSAERLVETGRFAIVLPADQEASLTRYARMCGMHLFRIVRVRTVPRKAPGRIIAEFLRTRTDAPKEELITIQDEGKYTVEYLSLMHDFYLFA